jgi:NADH-quinone oxidoreductase subunit M
MIFSLAAVALPLTSSFVGEFLILMGSWTNYPQWTVVAMAGVVVGAVYTLTAYLKTMFGPVSETVPLRRSDISGGDFVVITALALAVVGLGLIPSRILSIVEPAVSLQVEPKGLASAPKGSRAVPREGMDAQPLGPRVAAQTVSLPIHSDTALEYVVDR